VAPQVSLPKLRIPQIWEFSVEMGPLATEETKPTPPSASTRLAREHSVLGVSKAAHFEVSSCSFCVILFSCEKQAMSSWLNWNVVRTHLAVVCTCLELTVPSSTLSGGTRGAGIDAHPFHFGTGDRHDRTPCHQQHLGR